MAVDECGPDGAGVDSITCSAGNYAGGAVYPSFPNGIRYVSSDGLILTLDDAGTNIQNLGEGVLIEGGAAETGRVEVVGTSFSVIDTNAQFGSGIEASIENLTSPAEARTSLISGDIITRGDQSYGLLSRTLGLGPTYLSMDGGTVTTSGNRSYGLYSFISNATNTSTSTALLTGGSIVTNASSPAFDTMYGMLAFTSGLGDTLAHMSGGTITTSDNFNSVGLLAQNTNVSNTAESQARLTGGTIVTSGSSSAGVYALNHGLGTTLAQVDAGSIMTSGENAHGLYSFQFNTPANNVVGTAILASGSITTTGTTAHGIHVRTFGTGLQSATAGGTSTVEASGVDADGIRVDTSAQQGGSYQVFVSATAAVTGGSGVGAGVHTVSEAGDTGIINIAATATVDGTTNGTLGIVDDEGDVTVAVSGLVTGDIALGDGSDLLTIDTNAMVGNAGITLLDGGDDLTVADGFIDVLTFNITGMLNADKIINWEGIVVEGSLTTNGTLEVGDGPGLTVTGTLSTQDGAVDDIISVAGDYVGGGMLDFDTVLDDGTGGSDVLNVTGDTTGTTTVNINNVGGAGALTTGDGILVVTTGGGAGTFVLPGELRAGDYVYNLVKVGDNWYLQSVFNPIMVTPAEPVPAISVWGLLLLSGLIGLLGLFGRRKVM